MTTQEIELKIKEAQADALELCYQIEKIAASEDATKASVMASDLRQKLNSLLL